MLAPEKQNHSGKTNLDLREQEIVNGSGICWAICKSACSKQITMPAPNHSVFLQAGCPSCRPTNSVKALKANSNPAKADIVTLRVTIFQQDKRASVCIIVAITIFSDYIMLTIYRTSKDEAKT